MTSVVVNRSGFSTRMSVILIRAVVSAVLDPAAAATRSPSHDSLERANGMAGRDLSRPTASGVPAEAACRKFCPWVPLVRLMHRWGRVLGGPSVRAAFGGNLSLTWLSRRVMRRIAERTQQSLRAHQARRRSPWSQWAIRPCRPPAGGSILKVQEWLSASARR